MFSKELENLIQATLEDGILEEKEKVALVKRAQREGVDLDELEIYINSLLQRRQRELNQKKDEQEQKYEKEKKEAFGRTCPNCGKQVPPLTLKCDCGYEFTNNKNESSVEQLIEKIDKIRSRPLKGKPDSDEWDADKKLRDQQVLETISLFPVPNTKEDIVEFLSLAAPKSMKKGGRMGTVMGRLSIFIPILVVIIILVLILTPSTYVANVSDGIFSTSTHEEIRQTEIGLIITLIVIFGMPAIIALAYLLDTNTLQWNKSANVWRAKFEQVLMKGRSLRGDSDFQKQLDYYENMLNK